MSTELIKFHDTELYAVKDSENQPWIAVKPIADAIGLHADSALNRVKNDEILRRVHAVRHVHDASGRLQRMVCLPIEHVHGWLFSIDTKKVKADVRERLITFKLECYRALYDHFYGSTRKINGNLKRRQELVDENKDINKDITNLMKRHKVNELEIKAIDRDNSRQLGLFVNDMPEVDNNINIDVDNPDKQN